MCRVFSWIPLGICARIEEARAALPMGKLVYSDDNIVVTRTDPSSGDVVVDRYYDVSPVDGLADSTTPYETVSLREMQGIWEAGKKLALRNISSTPRNLITWVDLDNDGVVDSGEQMAFQHVQ